jgi:hypothetical protein
VPAGNYHLILDCFIGGNVTMTYELLWRRDGSDTTVLSFQQSYTKPTDDNIVVNSEFDEAGIAIDYRPGDLLVLRYTADAQSSPSAYTPDGDGPGPGSNGRYPNVTLPQ